MTMLSKTVDGTHDFNIHKYTFSTHFVVVVHKMLSILGKKCK